MSDDDLFYHMSMIMNADQAEIAKIVHDYIERCIGCGTVYDRLNCPKPPIYIKPVKLMTLRDRIIEEAAKELQNEVDKLILQKEDNEMKATSVQNIKNVKDISITIENDPIERESKLIIVASTNDDIFAFEFEGPDLLQSCKRAGLFTGWEKDQKIRELENQNKKILDTNRKLQEKIFCKDHTINELEKKNDELTKAYDILDKTLNKTQKKCNEWYEKWTKWLHKYENIKEEYKEKLDVLQRKYDLEKAANEAQRKFIKEYAGNDTEVTFNYAIGSGPITYGLYDKDYIDKLRKEIHYLVAKNTELETKLHDTAKEGDYVYLGSIPYSADDIKKLKEQIKKLEALKTPTIENFADEEPAADNVNHPSHYTGRYECIDVMQDVFGDEATDNFCLCNAFKYIWRARKKNGLEDVKKAVWYLNKYIEEAENGVRKGEQI